MNKLYKEIIGNMGANFTEFASTRAARAVSSLERLALGFERQTGIHICTNKKKTSMTHWHLDLVVKHRNTYPCFQRVLQH